MGAIYRIWNEANGKSYVGQSNRPHQRILRHLMPWASDGSQAIQKDLLKYHPDVWKWNIEVYDGGAGTNKLERSFIDKWDSYENGYNATPGGGARSSSPTHFETHISYAGKLFDRSEMRARITDAILDYQFREIHGISRAEYRWQQQIISKYGSLEAFDQHMEREMECWKQKREKRKRIGQLCICCGLYTLLALGGLMFIAWVIKAWNGG